MGGCVERAGLFGPHGLVHCQRGEWPFPEVLTFCMCLLYILALLLHSLIFHIWFWIWCFPHSMQWSSTHAILLSFQEKVPYWRSTRFVCYHCKWKE